MSDKNCVSFAGNPSGELVYADSRDPSRNRILRVSGDLSHHTFYLQDVDGTGYSDALKISGAENLTIIAGDIIGGTEDVLDVNHSKNVIVHMNKVTVKGRYLGTLKGGSENIQVDVEEVVGNPKYVFFDLGNWSDQSKQKTKGVRLNSKSSRVLSVRALHADKPSVNGNFSVKKPWWAPLFYPVMGILKKLKLA